jgi:hypothetical protein
MGATLATLRKYIRAEVGDPAPLRKISTSSLIHDGGNGAAFFQDATFNFVTLGIIIGDVVWNGSDGGSISVVRAIEDGGGTNDKLVVGSIEGGTDNDFDDGDTPWIYDRHAQRGLDGTRWTDTEVEDALAQAQKIVALRFGGVEKFNIHQDIEVMSKVDLTARSGTYQVGETITGGTNGHQATVQYVGDDFIVINKFITRVSIDGVSGTFEAGEKVTGSTNSYTGVVALVNANYLDLYRVTGTYDDDETLTGASTGATCSVNEAAGYSSGLFAATETLTGSTSSATGNVKAAYSANNICVGQDLPTDLKNLLVAKWWDGSHWQPLIRDDIFEYTAMNRSTGDPTHITVFGVDQLSTDATPQKKVWLWPNTSTKKFDQLHLFYMAWDRSLSGDTDTTDFDNRMERLIVLEGAKILAGQVNEDDLYKRIVTDIQLMNADINSSGDNETDEVRQSIHWDYGWNDEGAFIP